MKYKELVEAVRKLDKEAAEYLEGPAKDLGSFASSDQDALVDVFCWGNTPQGHGYWSRLSKLLDE